jgi:hypothetical protein
MDLLDRFRFRRRSSGLSPVVIEPKVEFSAIVMRCGCGDPKSHLPEPCPTPRAVEDLGVIVSRKE